MRTLALSTVSAAGHPRVSGVDGHLPPGTKSVTITARPLNSDTGSACAHRSAGMPWQNMFPCWIKARGDAESMIPKALRYI